MRMTFCATGAGGELIPERAFSAIHLSHGEARLLLECGPGSLERLVRAGLDLRRLDALVFSHLHPNHALGLADLLSRLSGHKMQIVKQWSVYTGGGSLRESGSRVLSGLKATGPTKRGNPASVDGALGDLHLLDRGPPASDEHPALRRQRNRQAGPGP